MGIFKKLFCESLGSGIEIYVPPRPVPPFNADACPCCGGKQGHWFDCEIGGRSEYRKKEEKTL